MQNSKVCGMFPYIFIMFIINAISFSLLGYVPCVFYLFIATCVSSQVKILPFR